MKQRKFTGMDRTAFSTLKIFEQYKAKALSDGYGLMNSPIAGSSGYETTMLKIFYKNGDYRIAAYDSEGDAQKMWEVLDVIKMVLEQIHGVITNETPSMFPVDLGKE